MALVNIRDYCTSCMSIIMIINPRRACAARVTVVVPCVCVRSNLPPHTHWNHKSEVPTDSSQYGNDFKGDLTKMLRSVATPSFLGAIESFRSTFTLNVDVIKRHKIARATLNA